MERQKTLPQDANHQDDPGQLSLHEWSVYTIRDFRDIKKAIEVGSITFTEKVSWRTGADALRDIQRQRGNLPILLADSTSRQMGVMAWGIARGITIQGNTTTVHIDRVRALKARPVIWSLQRQKTGELLSENDQRNYRLVITPKFLLGAPKTFLLTWNPKSRVPGEVLIDVRDSIQQGKQPEWNWTCRSINKVSPGDRFLMLRQGELPRGLVGSGWIRSFGYRDDANEPYVEILWEHMLHPDHPLDPHSVAGATEFYWRPQGSGVELVEPVCSAIWRAWDLRMSQAEPPHST